MTMLATPFEETIDSTKGVKIFVRSWVPAPQRHRQGGCDGGHQGLD
jgi:hypothetical protein